MGFLLLVSGMIPPDVRDQRSWKELRGSWKFRRGNSTRISQITRYYDIFTNIEMYATYKIIMYIGDVFNIFQSYLMIDIIIIIITIYCSPVLVWNFRSFFAASHQLHQVVISCPLHCRKWSMSCHDKKPERPIREMLLLKAKNMTFQEVMLTLECHFRKMCILSLVEWCLRALIKSWSLPKNWMWKFDEVLDSGVKGLEAFTSLWGVGPERK